MKQRIFVLLLALSMAVSLAQAADPVGKILALEGKATVTSQDGQTRALDLGSPIYLNDKVVTAEGSKLQISFVDDSVISQGEKGELLVDEYVFSASKKDDNVSSLKMVKGMFRVITGKITKLNPERFRVRTKMATIGIRGCDVGFTVTEKEANVYVIQLSGKESVTVYARAGEGGGKVGGGEWDGLIAGKWDDPAVAKQQLINVTKPNRIVSVTAGAGTPKERPLQPDELTKLIMAVTPEGKGAGTTGTGTGGTTTGTGGTNGKGKSGEGDKDTGSGSSGGTPPKEGGTKSGDGTTTTDSTKGTGTTTGETPPANGTTGGGTPSGTGTDTGTPPAGGTGTTTPSAGGIPPSTGGTPPASGGDSALGGGVTPVPTAPVIDTMVPIGGMIGGGTQLGGGPPPVAPPSGSTMDQAAATQVATDTQQAGGSTTPTGSDPVSPLLITPPGTPSTPPSGSTTPPAPPPDKTPPLDVTPPPSVQTFTPMGGGADWSWGKWDTDGMLNRVSVSGNNLPAADYLAIVNGATKFSLTGSGTAAAVLSLGGYKSLVTGTCNLNVFIGGSRTPYWNGTFDMANGALDTLSFGTGGSINNGTLEAATLGPFSMKINRTTSSKSDVTWTFSGNLLGPAGSVKPTGASGSYGFDGVGGNAKGIFGTDLH